MKTFLITIFLAIGQITFANSVDSLQNDQDVFTFLNRIGYKQYFKRQDPIQILSTEGLKEKMGCDSIFKMLNVRNWEKVDFNNDKRNDLVVTLWWYSWEVFIAIDKGENTFQLIRLSQRGSENCLLAKPIMHDNKQLLAFYRIENTYNQPIKNVFDFKLALRIDTLIYIFGGFVEFQKNNAQYDIEEIQFNASSGWSGISPVSKLKQLNSKEWQLESFSENSKKITCPNLISTESVSSLMSLINYMNIQGLFNKYMVQYTCSATIYLRIRFKDGTVKEIEDYGLDGTFSLRLFYELLSKLRGSSPL